MKKIPWALQDKTDNFLLLRSLNSSLNGISVRQQFYELIQNNGRRRHYRHAHEWCCGSGAIGFYLLHNQLCDKLTLSDINESDLTGCAYTAAANNIQTLVNIYQINRIADLEQDEKWDLVVANPPWRSYVPEVTWGHLTSEEIRTMVDLDWTIHNNMWQDISTYLYEDADVFLYEDATFSNEHTWQDQIQAAGLKIYNIHKHFGPFDSGYILHLIRA